MGEEEYVCPHCGREILEFSNVNAAMDMLEMKLATQAADIRMLICDVAKLQKIVEERIR